MSKENVNVRLEALRLAAEVNKDGSDSTIFRQARVFEEFLSGQDDPDSASQNGAAIERINAMRKKNTVPNMTVLAIVRAASELNDLECHEACRAACAILEMERDRKMGRSFANHETAVKLQGLIAAYPKHRDTINGEIRVACESGQTAVFKLKEFTVCVKDGQIVPASEMGNKI